MLVCLALVAAIRSDTKVGFLITFLSMAKQIICAQDEFVPTIMQMDQTDQQFLMLSIQEVFHAIPPPLNGLLLKLFELLG